MKACTFFLCWLGTLISYSKLLSAAVIMKFCPSSVYLSCQDPPGFPVFAWPLSTSSPSQSVTPVRPTTPPKNPESRTRRTHCTHTHTHTHTHTYRERCFMNCGKKYTFCDRGLRVRQCNICCYLWAAGSKWGIQWLFKAPVSSGQLGLHCYCFN